MTQIISIAKPLSQRTAKGLILSGADGKKARRDGRHPEVEKDYWGPRRPLLDTGTAIVDSLDGGLLDGWGNYDPYWDTRSNRLKGVWTSESSGFGLQPAQPRKVSRRDLIKATAARLPELPTHDEQGRPIVYKTDDAWSLPRYRR